MDAWWTAPLSDVVGGARVVLAGASAAAWTEHLGFLRAAGAADLLVVASSWGAGDPPDVETVVVEAPTGMATMEQIRFDERFLADPPAEVADALDRFDPDGDALVLGTFLNTNSHLAGRPFVSYRRPEWLALEDKVVVDAFFDRAGVARQPSVVVALGDASEASSSIDRGDGTVWAADARDGFHGGASQTYWVADDESRRTATAGLATVCDLVRIMPFVDGVPCSIHGIVLPDGVAVLRPVEMITLRRGHEFVYAGCATFWDPPAPVRDQMRSIARSVGTQLADEVRFRGTFTVDGVAGSDGFWPTELNPRFGAGINAIARASGLPIVLVNDLVVGGHDLGRSAADIEYELVERADRYRGGGTWMGGLTIDDERSELLADGATVTVGSSFVRCLWNPADTSIGSSTAPRACDFWATVDRSLRTGIGPLRPAPDLRARARPIRRWP
jgi:hypothetical protein